MRYIFTLEYKLIQGKATSGQVPRVVRLDGVCYVCMTSALKNGPPVKLRSTLPLLGGCMGGSRIYFRGFQPSTHLVRDHSIFCKQRRMVCKEPLKGGFQKPQTPPPPPPPICPPDKNIISLSDSEILACFFHLIMI